MLRRTVALGLASTAICSRQVFAQEWPNRTIRWIVPFPPGGSADTAARPLAEVLSKALGQPVVVENRAGAAGNIGTDFVAKSPPDGYTILSAVDSVVLSPHVDPKLPFDPLKDFAAVTQLTRQPLMLAVHPSLGVASVAELVAYVKQRPGLAYATSGAGTQQHLAGEWFARRADIKLTHVPYRGGGQAIGDLVSGQITLACLGSSPLIPHWRSGAVKLLAQTTAQRSPGLEAIPTVGEAGYPDIVLDQWLGVVVPARTPPTIVARLHTEITKALADPATRELYAKVTLEPVGNTPAEFSALIVDYHTKYGRLVRELGIKIE
jgi:tripartite-type tricarboxylate transporter receptor subunit TctC